MDSEFRQALRAAQSTDSDMDYQAAILVGQRAGYTPLRLAQMGIPVRFFAEQLSILESPTDDGALNGTDLSGLGLNASTMPGAELYPTGWYVPTKRVRLPSYDDYIGQPGVDRYGWREASQEYLQLPTGQVLLSKGWNEYVIITDQSIIDAVSEAARTTAIIAEARIALAKHHALGDPIMERLLRWNIWYNQGQISDPHYIGDIPFWPVGRNSSHSFYAGYRNGQRYRYSVGEGDDYDDEMSRVQAVDDWVGYYGHA